jgi:phage shock protein E
MFEALKKFLGQGPTADFSQLVESGAIILDVRTSGEFAQGHSKDAMNISLDQLAKKLESFPDKNKHIITCCASGMRSGSAKVMLESKGYTNVHNGGGWISLQQKLLK